MNQALEIRKTPDGKVFARRKDGLPLTLEDRQEAARLVQELSPVCWNCGQKMTEATDIYNEPVFVCWHCATWV